jgi:hypothetical protein
MKLWIMPFRLSSGVRINKFVNHIKIILINALKQVINDANNWKLINNIKLENAKQQLITIMANKTHYLRQ